MRSPDNSIVLESVRALRRRLPPGWTIDEPSFVSPRDVRARRVDAVAQLHAPDSRSCALQLEAVTRLLPKSVAPKLEAVREVRDRGPLVVVSPYLSASVRERLCAADVGYLDLTGNVRIAVTKPGLYVETQGASEDPNREERPARSLRGPKAGRLVRALIDRQTPPGVRELAAATQIDPGYVSRVLSLLEDEALVTRGERGRLETVDWPALLRRWAAEAPLDARGTTRTYLEPRGLSTLVARLAKSDEKYVVTGSLAAAAYAPAAPARLAAIWVRDANAAAVRLGLRSVDSGTNVLLLEPNDEGVFEGAAQRNDAWYAAPSQIAADLLTSPGRGPAEGEELIAWMKGHEAEWRA